jgi:glycosyltransferase involved in cell wall biosynthesis
VHVIRNAVVPVAVGDDERSRIRQSWGFGAAAVVVGCVGNLQPGKGHDLLLDLAGELRPDYPDVRWCFVGDGPIRAHLESRIEALGLDGTVVLHTREPDARRLYAAFDIAVQASDSEGLPNVVLEAAVAGLPIVATAVGGTGEIVSSGEDGLLVPKGDRNAMGAAIRRLLDDGGLRGRLGSAARVRAADFSVERLVDLTASLYEQLIAQRGRRGQAGR